jgi:MFS family permease
MKPIPHLISNFSRSLVPVIASTGAVGLSIGLLIPLVSIALENQGAPVFIIGLNATVFSLVVLILGPFFPTIIHHLGHLKSMAIGAVVSGILVAAFAFNDSIWYWFLLRALIGVFGGLNWVSSEAWIIATAPEASRGRVIGAYTTIWGLGIASGPVLLKFVGVAGALPFIFGGCIMAGAALPLLAVPRAEGKKSVTSTTFGYGMLSLAPVAMGAGFVSGYLETATLSLLPVYGLHSGLTASRALALVSLFAIGTVLMQPLVGWIADKVSYKILLSLIAAISALVVAIIPSCLRLPFIIEPLIFLWGGSIGGYYTLGMINLGQRFNGSELTAASSMFVMAYTCGMVIGPLFGSVSMQLSDPHGLLVMLGLVPLLFFILLLRRNSAPTDKIDF